MTYLSKSRHLADCRKRYFTDRRDGCAMFFASNSDGAGCNSASTASRSSRVVPFEGPRDLTLQDFDLLAQRDLDRERAYSAHSRMASRGIMAMPISSTMASSSHLMAVAASADARPPCYWPCAR